MWHECYYKAKIYVTEEYFMRDYRKMWKISLIVLACVTLIFAITYFADITLPDMLIRILGTLSLCAIFELVFSSVKLKIWKRKQ